MGSNSIYSSAAVRNVPHDTDRSVEDKGGKRWNRSYLLMLNFGAVTSIHGRNVTFSYTHQRMLPPTAVVCQWWKPGFVVGCESVNIGHDQPWELSPAAAGKLSAQKLDDFLAFCHRCSFRFGQISYLKGIFGLGFCFPKSFIDLCSGLTSVPWLLLILFHLCISVHTVNARMASLHNNMQRLNILIFFSPKGIFVSHFIPHSKSNPLPTVQCHC